jgi:hypothetical protein
VPIIYQAQMTYLHSKIAIFYNHYNANFKPILEAIINNMLKICEYTNGETLYRHNWGGKPVKLKNIPSDINSKNFDEELLQALDCDENEKAIIELLWGDVQLGKRVQACIIMWFSVYILERPVIYIFRNLGIDRDQLQADIEGVDDYSFNIQHIRNIVDKFNDLLNEHLGDNYNEYWHKLKLPPINDLRINNNMNKLSNKNSIRSSDIYGALMNDVSLDEINKKLSEYIAHNNELVNVTLLIDEGDLVTPTASNDASNNKDCSDTTKYEKLLAIISKKVKYSLKITGTAHSLFWNFTTRLGHNNYIQNKISKVHKMKRTNDYYGIMNSQINFNTEQITTWWKYQEPNPDTTAKNKMITVKNKYTLKKDYEINIKNMIQTILNRTNTLYSSLLISEEKIRNFQFDLVYNHILKDFSHLFLIVFHGKCLQVYFHKSYAKEIKQLSKKEGRLYKEGGVIANPYNTYEDDKGNDNTLPNNYCYYNIDSKKFNIKMVYKLLKMLFTDSQLHIKNKTVITITGKYGERGYSFTSDDYGKYSFHLTDQYLVSHAAFNCTDIAQRIRLQGKYKDKELTNGLMKLTLWTTNELKDVIQSFYIKFIKELEQYIMNCNTFEEIQELIENIIDNGEMKFRKYMKYLDVAKKRKNIKLNKHFDKKYNGYRLCIYNDMSDSEIENWCKESKLPDYICVNDILETTEVKFIEDYGIYANDVPISINKSKLNIKKEGNSYDRTEITSILYDLYPQLKKYILDRIVPIKKNDPNSDRYAGFETAILNNEPYNHYITKRKPDTFNILYYPDSDYENIHISIITKNKTFPNQTTNVQKRSYMRINNTVVYSELKPEYKGQDLPDNYYWKTPDGWLFLYMKSKQDIISLNITSPIPDNISETSSETSSDSDSNIIEFTTDCITPSTSAQLRFGIADIYTTYKDWCKNKNKKHINRALFKDELERLNYKEEKSKGVDINGKSGKRGYNIMVELK